MNERPIPNAALEDENAVEMLRVWIASKGLHCSMKVGMYKESTKIPEEKAWGILLADVARHLSDALEKKYATDRQAALERIRTSFEEELNKPTSKTKGEFVSRQ